MKYTVEKITSYLDTLRKIEADIYTHNCVIDRVEQQIAQVKQRYQNNQYKPLIKTHPSDYYEPEDLKAKSRRYGWLGALVGLFVGLILALIILTFNLSMGGCIAGIIILIACILVFALKNYQDYYKSFENKSKLYKADTEKNERIKKENEASRQRDRRLISLLEQISTKLGANCYQLEQVRNRLY